MATDLGKKPVKSTGAKHDAFVQAQLARAEKRIRRLDLSVALLGFAAIICVFLVGAMLCDRAWALPDWLRQLSFVGFVAGSGVYLYLMLARPLLYRVNPYYAAQRVEQTLPGAKNSVVSWLDLQQEKLPPAIRAAVGQKAAKDLSKADLDSAFNPQRLVWSGGAAAACAGGLIACFIWLGGDAFFHLQRIFTPFSFASTARTTLTITRPSNGDDIVTLKRPVSIAVHVDGKIPDPKSPEAVKLLIRYQENEPYLERRMRQEGSDFTASVAAEDVRDGFLYKIVAGDAETLEYRISVRATPLLKSVQATYHFRPYVAREDEEHYGRRTFKLEALRGTEITLSVRTTRPVKEAYLVLEGQDGKEQFPAEKNEDNPNAFQVKHTVERTVRYRLEYTTPDGESYADPSFQDLVAVVDQPPQPVDITSPGRDIQLPCNGVLQVEGAATDDVGVKSMTLQMRVDKLGDLRGKAYRSDREVRLPSGGYPLALAYKDYVDLKTVKLLSGTLLALQPGMELEYWLEAADACDYPKPNVTASKHYRVKLLPSETDPEKQKNQRDQAKQEQQQHETKQNDALKKEGQKRKEEEDRRKEEAEHKKNETNENKSNENTGNQQPNEAQPKQPNETGNQSADPKDNKTKETADKLKSELDKNNQEQKPGEKGTAKGDPKEPNGQPKDAGASEKKPAAESKPSGKPEDNKNAGDSKPAGAKPDPKNAPGEAKPQDKSDPMQSSALNKPDTPRPDSPPSEKSQTKDQPKADAKNPPKPEQKQEAAQQKPEGRNSEQVCNRAECKHGAENPNSQQAAQPKEVPNPTDKSSGKNDGSPQPGDQPKGQPKSGGTAGEAADNKPAQPKTEDIAKADPKPDQKANGGSQGTKVDPKQATPDDVSKLSQDIGSKDKQDRQDAAQKLEKIAKEANDPKVREQAKDALEEKKIKEPTAAEAKEPPPKDKQGNGNGEKVCAAKGSQGAQPGSTGEAKSGEPMQQQVPPGIRKGHEAPGNGQFVPQPPDVAQAKEKPPFLPDENLLPSKEGPTAPSKPVDNKATMMQLQEFKKAVDKKTLEKAGLTPEQYKQFLKDYANLAKRQDPAAQNPAAPQNQGSLSGLGSTRVNPGATTTNEVRGSDRVKPPSGYGDAWIQFTRERSATKDK